MNGYLLDTSVIVEYVKGNQKVINIIDTLEGEMSTSYVVLSELYEGIFRSKNEVEKNIVGFVESLDKIYGLDKKVSKNFGRIRSDLKKKGNVIEDMDILISATCLANDLAILTLNKKHFERIVNLKVFSPEDFG